MTRFSERDEYQVGTLVNGFPTCVFHPKPYKRIITNIVVSNSATGPVFCYRGILGGTPIAQNLLGSNNTVKGDLEIPAGQSFFVQWTVLGASVRDAFARVSWERDDNPLVAGADRGEEWASNAITTLQVPNAAGIDEPAIIIGNELPPCMSNIYSSAIFWRPPGTLIASGGAPYYFVAQRNNPTGGAGWQQVDEGFLVYDAAGGVCVFAVYRSKRAQTSNPGPYQFDVLEEVGNILSSGAVVVPEIRYLAATTKIEIRTNIDWNGCVTLDATDATNFNTTSVAYTAAGASNIGVVFTVPPSGKVLLNYGSFLSVSTSGHGVYMSIVIREGNTFGAGTIILNALDNNAVIEANTAGNPSRQGVSYLFDNGVAGSVYNVQLMHRSTGATVTLADRYVIAQPVF